MLLPLTKLIAIQTQGRKKMQRKTSDDKRMPFMISKFSQVSAEVRQWGMTLYLTKILWRNCYSFYYVSEVPNVYQMTSNGNNVGWGFQLFLCPHLMHMCSNWTEVSLVSFPFLMAIGACVFQLKLLWQPDGNIIFFLFSFAYKHMLIYPLSFSYVILF